MANRYWVGDGGRWHGTDHWSATSGGASGASEPTANDDVYFDANSFSSNGQTIYQGGNSILTTIYCKAINFTGVTNNPTLLKGSACTWEISGSITFVADMTMDDAGGANWVYIKNTTGNITITMANHHQDNGFLMDLDSNTCTLLDNLSSTFIHLQSGTLDVNNQDIAAYGGSSRIYNGATFTMGSGEIYFGIFTIDDGTTINADTSTLKTYRLTNNDTETVLNDIIVPNNFSYTFTGNGFTANNVIINGTVDRTQTIKFEAGETYTFTTFTSNGNGVNDKITLQSDSSGSQATLSVSDSVTVSYLKVQDMIGAGAQIPFNATIFCEDLGNNLNWIFMLSQANIF